MNFALLLTWSRIAAIPVIILVYFLPYQYAHPIAAFAFGLVAITDWLDGYVARNLHQCTKLGAFLDPVADKLLVSISLLMILSQQYMPFLALPAAVIVGRELTISALREWMAEIGKRTSVAVTQLAKVKTVMQMFAIAILLFYTNSMSVFILYLGVTLLCISAVLTLYSMIIYLKTAWPDLTLSEEKQ